jgi:hypothetical protein
MSWGERSCGHSIPCDHICELHTCNVDCPGYYWDGKTKPDSIPKSMRKDFVGEIKYKKD